MFNTIVQAHEEGVSTGSDAWLGPLMFFVIILVAIIAAKLILRKRKQNPPESGEIEEVRENE